MLILFFKIITDTKTFKFYFFILTAITFTLFLDLLLEYSCLPMQEMQVQSLGWEDPLEKGMATHSHIFA